MQTRWEIKNCDEIAVKQLAQQLSVSELMARLLILRGITNPEEVKAFLYQDDLCTLTSPMLLSGMKALKQRVYQAIAQKEKILIYGDYDVDGICSVIILMECLQYLGASVDYRVPNRFSEGYGLNCSAVEEISAQGYQLIITVDCGITSIEEAECCKKLGVDLIITDHHTMGKELPDALALVNPKIDNLEETRGLAGAGVAFKVAYALTADRIPQISLNEWVILAAIATVADVVPVLRENRVIVRKGLQLLQGTHRPGLQKLLQSEGMLEQQITTEKLAFQVIPKLNSAGRMETADISIRALLTQDDAESDYLIGRLLELNEQRRKIEDEMLQKAIQDIESHAHTLEAPLLVVQGKEWNHGVVGILASRLVTKYHKPTLVISWDKGIGKGSGRSIEGVSLYDILASGRSCLMRFGGHKMAAGLTISHENFAVYYQTIMQKAQEIMQQLPAAYTYWIDAAVTPRQLATEGEELLRKLEPMGEGNPSPLFLLRGVEADFYKKIGKKQEHLLCRLDKLEGVAFQQSDMLNREQLYCQQDLVLGLSCNEYMGIKRTQMIIREFHPSYRYDEKTGKETPGFLKKIRYIIHKLLNREPVLLLYDDVRSLKKHSVQLQFYLKTGSLCYLHGEIPLQNRSFAEHALLRGEGKIFLVTYAALKQWQQKNQLPDTLKEVFCCWNRPRQEESLFPPKVQQYTWEAKEAGEPPIRLGKKENTGRGMIYVNRPSSLDKIKERFPHCINEVQQDMKERALLRQKWVQENQPLLTDGVPTEESEMDVPEWLELADVPYTYCELEPYLRMHRKRPFPIYSSFTLQDVQAAYQVLEQIFPESDTLLGQMQQFLIRYLDLNKIYSIDSAKFRQMYWNKTGKKIPTSVIEGLLQISAEIRFCEYKKKGSVLVLKLLTNREILKKERSLWFWEGCESKAALRYCLQRTGVLHDNEEENVL